MLRLKTLKAEATPCLTHCAFFAVSADFSVASSAGSVAKLTNRQPSLF
jgi:transcriptional regulator of nitric oxide reductase